MLIVFGFVGIVDFCVLVCSLAFCLLGGDNCGACRFWIIGAFLSCVLLRLFGGHLCLCCVCCCWCFAYYKFLGLFI